MTKSAKRLLAYLVAGAMFALVFAVPGFAQGLLRQEAPVGYSAATDFPGAGTLEDPYQIGSGQDLALLAELVNSGAAGYDKAHYRQTDDIDLSAWASGEGWSPIGWYDGDNDIPYYFKGMYDGDGCAVTGLYIDRPEAGRQGLFGHVDGGAIRNLRVDGQVTAGWVSGLVAASLSGNGMIEDCETSGSINGTLSIGGVVGGMYDNARVMNSHNSADVNGISSVGGIVGDRSGGSLTGCSNSGEISAVEQQGDLVGWNVFGGDTQGRAASMRAAQTDVRARTYGPPVDKLELVSITPENGATGVSTGASIVMTFNAEISSAYSTVNEEYGWEYGIILREAGTRKAVPINVVIGDGNWEVTSNMVTLTPKSGALKVDTAYTLEIPMFALRDFYYGYYEMEEGAYSFTTGGYEEPNPGEAEPGDLTGDGAIDARDVRLLKRAVARIETLTPAQQAVADVTGDGIFDARDARKLSQYVARIIPSLD